MHTAYVETSPEGAYEILWLMNTTILTGLPGESDPEATYTVRRIADPAAYVAALPYATTVVSGIGHDAAAEAMSTALGIEVPPNRIQFTQRVGDSALCLKLNGRRPEGQKVLDASAMSAVGYDFYLITRTT